MVNKELSAVFNEIAALMEILGESKFRINSYQRTARTLKDLTKDVAQLAESGELEKLPGVGKATIEKIQSYLKDGAIDTHQELLAKVPAGLPKLLSIPGMGPKKVALAWKELNVEGIEDLKRVIASGELAGLKGMGEKSVKQIADGIAFAESTSGRTPLGLAWPLADELAAAMRGVAGVRRVEVAGSLRRGCETIGDLDLLCESDDGPAVVAAFTSHAKAKRVLASGDTKGSIIVERRDGEEIQVDCRVVPNASFGAALQYFTGSKEHNVRLRERAIRRGWKLNEWGLFEGETQIAGADESEIYTKLDLPHFPPELREDRGEFELKQSPRLVEISDIRGDLHTHTTASDGKDDAETMVRAACERNYEFIAITDHTKSSAIANGLSIDRMWRQIEKIRQLNEKIDTVSVLVGCECDILADGELDYPDSLLAACDFVVASVHSGMRQDREKVTTRVLRAIESPYVNVIGHPTTRLINRREPIDLDMEAVVARAAETGTALECNASWQRLDLHDRHIRMALDAGVKISINTDSHAVAQFDQMKFGIVTARRGGATPADVINTWHLPKIREWIAKKRSI
ncbi:MAG TPA: DNA polymerase/3'-5' exonuclease PolX [Phycisphaerae bacterium]|nr:DNA polymerase/3'-5' exonuclease PolX [Phycisphaerae bacterium]HRW55322.1 DNA polymerase/3'-5' exonuclease PolX [Phycisphaerae bacterium]